MKQGSKLYIEGQHQTRKWEADNGETKYMSECVLQGFNGTLVLLDKMNSSQRQEQPAQEQQQPSSKEFDDVIPF